ncbi:MAG: hypothetical protein ABGX07_14705 [Pirellulaceae bacterium]
MLTIYRRAQGRSTGWIAEHRTPDNTRQLVRLCHEHLTPALHVEGADELEPEWFADVEPVGLTAGTSTLDSTIEEVHQALVRIG